MDVGVPKSRVASLGTHLRARHPKVFHVWLTGLFQGRGDKSWRRGPQRHGRCREAKEGSWGQKGAVDK